VIYPAAASLRAKRSNPLYCARLNVWVASPAARNDAWGENASSSFTNFGLRIVLIHDNIRIKQQR
jgi:hypothetical protein